MSNLRDINKYILEQVKNNGFSKKMALPILKILNDKPENQREDIAIIGMAGKFPGADNPEQFWELLAKGENCIRPFPENRKKDALKVFPEGHKAKFFQAGFLDEIDKFDAEYFNIPPRSAELMDPYQRIFLETVVESVQDAGISPKDFYGSNTGIYVGTDHTHKFRASYLSLIGDADFTAMTGSWAGILSSRASYIFDLKGPGIVVDSACSSGLSALNVACNALYQGDCDQAIVGSANLFILPTTDDGQMSLNDIEAKDIKVRTFDKEASGTAWGEGVCSILIKPLSKAIKDKDPIHAVIKSALVNNDGASNGITAPNAKAQTNLIKKAWKQAKVTAEDITYIEAHGTGTKLGDPIEIKGLNDVFDKETDKKQYCGIGSVKTNVGHAVGSAALISLVKVVMSLKKKQLAPTINFDEPNEFINFCKSSLYINTKLSPWETNGSLRTAGINSFSFNGTNCHVVMQEAPALPKVLSKNTFYIFTLSGRSEDLFKQTVSDYLYFFEKTKDSLSVEEVCFTVNSGREDHGLRLVLVVKTIDDIKNGLKLIENDGFKNYDDIIYFNDSSEIQKDRKILKKQTTEAKDFMTSLVDKEILDQSDLVRLAKIYTDGATLDWNAFYKNQSLQKVHLPVYPFKKTRYWIENPVCIMGGAPAEKSVSNKKEIELIGADLENHETAYLVAQIWGSVLGYDSIKITDNFYELGGDSVLAMQVITALNQELKTEMQVSALLGNSEFSAFIKTLDIPKQGIESDIIKVSNSEQSYDCSAAQARMYMLWEMDRLSVLYNIAGTVILPAKLNVDKVRTAINKLAIRHEAFRTVFKMQDKPVQHILDSIEIPVLEIDKTTVELTNLETSVNDWMQDLIAPFDLENGPLARVFLIQLAGDKSAIILDFHHIISDGTSMGIFVRELGILLSDNNLAPLIFQYKDFANWQNNVLISTEYQKHKAFWKDQFSDEIPVLELPVDYKRPEVQSFKGTVKSVVWSKEDLLILKKFAKESDSTLFMVLTAGLNILMSKYSGQEDVVIGIPVAARPKAEFYHLMGVFVNTLALRNKPNSNKSIDAFIKEVKQNALNAYDHQDYPFDLLVEDLQVNRDSGRNPLFDVMFELQNEDIGVNRMSDDVTFHEFKNGSSKFDLSFLAKETIDGLKIDLEYSTDLFLAETIERLIGHFKNILLFLVSNKKTQISEIDYLFESDKELLINTFNQTQVDYPSEKCIVSLFDEQLKKHANKIGLAGGGKEFTYNQLDKISNQLSNILVEKGITKGDRVGLLLDRSVEAVIASLAIAKIKAVFVPFDPDAPQERITHIINDSSIKLVCTLKDLEDRLPENTECIIADNPEIYLGVKDTYSYTKAQALDPVYIMYTSGSTGMPKGVEICHKNIVRLVKNNDYVTFDHSLRLIQTGAPAFDAITFEWWGALLNGGFVYIPIKDTLLNAAELGDLIRKQEINVVFITTQLFNQLVDESVQVFSTLNSLLVGGEVLSPSHMNRVRETNPDLIVSNIYGPTESTTFSVVYPINKTFNDAIPIGYPIKNTTAFILDKSSRLVAPGVVGELCLGGDGVALGYLNNPELTDEKFIDNPFGEGQLYKSGDLARFLPDGAIEFIGRRDFQIKIRGFRIELGEVELAVLKHSNIAQTFVTVKLDGDGNKQLVSFYTTKDNQPLAYADLKKFLLDEVPAYMVPIYFKQLPNMPLNSNGKVDKKVLPKPELVKYIYVAASTELQQKLLMVWKEILPEVDRISIYDDFFAIGGQSLKATRLSAKLKEKANINLALTDIFKYVTIAAQEDCILNKSSINQTLPKIEKCKEQDIYPTSTAQRRLFSLQQISDSGTAYNMPGVFVMAETPDFEKFGFAVNALVERHEALRTNFFIKDGKTVQKIKDQLIIDVNQYNVSTKEELDNCVHNFINPFNLESDQLFRACIVNLEPDVLKTGAKAILVFDMHHTISDGISVGILIKEFKNIYAGKSLDKPSLQYKDFAVWENDIRAHGLLEVHKNYWLNQLDGELPKLEFPTDFVRPAVQKFEGSKYTFTLNSSVAKGFIKTSKDNGFTLHVALLGMYKILLSKYTNQSDIIVGVPVAGRHEEALFDVMGMFVNSLAIRSNVENDKRIISFLNEVKDLSIGAYENQLYPFDELVEDLELDRDTSRNPVFDTMFVLQESMNITDQEYSYDPGISKFDLLLQTWSSDETITFEFEYSTALFKEETIALLASRLELLIEQFCKNPKQSINEIDLCTDTDRSLILNDFNNTSVPYPNEKSVISIFNECVKKYGDNIALTDENLRLTYNELNKKANALAYILQSKGVKPESKVGLYFNRNTDFIIAILATFKAGGAYVPIGTSYPQDRISFMENDSDLSLVISDLKEAKNKFTKDIVWMQDVDFESEKSVDVQLTANNLCYIMYTSGSTGKPKGVMVEHKNVVRLVQNTNFVKLNSQTSILLTGAPVFDATTFEIWGALLNGGQLHIIEEDKLLNASLLGASILEKSINTMWLTSPLFNQLVDQNETIFKSLKFLIVGGDILSPQHINRLRKAYPSIQLVNGYGPTENVTFSVTYNINEDHTRIPIGKPINNSTAYILNNNHKLLPVGLSGELYVGGEGVSRGYLNAPELTAERFINNPFGEGRLYKTGDLARWLPNGTIDFMGRRDLQVKIRGYRIELGEIEYALLQLPSIQKTIVIPVVIGGNKSLCAYIEAKEKIDLSELKSGLKSTLPDYMVPSYYVIMEALPLTINGKVDRRKLPHPEAIRDEFQIPVGKVEEIMASVWSEVLGVENISRNDNFFSLGGDSIKAIQVSSRLQLEKIKIEVNQIFALAVLKNICSEATIYEVFAEQGEVSGTADLSPVQNWFVDLNLKQSQYFNQGIELYSEKILELSKVKGALDAIVKHHDALRIIVKDRQLLNRTFDNGDFYVIEEILDLENEFSKDKYEIIFKEKQLKADIENGPLTQLLLIHSKDGSRLWWATHHMVVDGVSWRILIEDFQNGYKAIEENVAIEFPSKTTAFIRWPEKLKEYVNAGELKKEYNYWTSVLKSEHQYLISKKSAERQLRTTSASDKIIFNKELTKALLTEVHTAYNTNANDVLLAAVSMALKSWKGITQTIINLEGHGREELFENIDITRTVGWFTAMYPVVLGSENSFGIGGTLKKIKDNLHKIPSKGIGYGMLRYFQDSWSSEDLKNGTPQISFNYLGQFANGSSGKTGFVIEPLSPEVTLSSEDYRLYPLDINSWVINEELYVVMDYSYEEFTSNEINEFSEYFKQNLTDIIAHCLDKEGTEITLSDFTSSDIEESEFEDILDDLGFE
ncbi:MAG: hypothetical protein COA88_02420 [Kordia sp.]|nr:MAG: hypothetical protein COA88_02420 [Kordia sp.]